MRINRSPLPALLLLLLRADLSLGQDDGGDIGCYVPGECAAGSDILTAIPAVDATECLEYCKTFNPTGGDHDCNDFTYYSDTETCVLYENCASLDASGCGDCVSGSSNCTLLPCFVEGWGCRGTSIANVFDVPSAEDCRAECCEVELCSWCTFYSDSGLCVLMEECGGVARCGVCSISAKDNPNCELEEEGDGDGEEEEGEVLIAMGGWDYDYLDSSESVDLLAGGGGSCSRSLRDLPEPVEYNLGLSRPSDGAPMSCGGITFSGGTKGARSCWVYRQALDDWVEGPEMVTPRPSGAQAVRLSDGRYFVLGSSEAANASSTEILGPSDTFSSSFDLPSPYGFSFGCAAEVEPGVVFVSGGELYQEQAYLVDVSTGAGIRLQDLPAGRTRHSCGAIRSGVRGTEVVVAGGDAESTTDIFNLDLQAWRPGPFLPVDLYGAASAPGPSGEYLSSFLVAGGFSSSREDFQFAIYEYSAEEGDWSRREEGLKDERAYFALAAVDRGAAGC